MSKRAEEAAEEYFRGSNPYREHPEEEWEKEGFISGYEQAEKDLGWHSVDESLPEVDVEVIVLTTDQVEELIYYRISFGHRIKNTTIKVRIGSKTSEITPKNFNNGWNIPGVKFWMPCPKIPNEEL
jgi:hypothetical protein